MSVYIAPIGNGLGDLVVSLPAVQHLISSGAAVVLVLRSPRQEGLAELIPGLSGWVREVDVDSATITGAGHRYINLREHPLQTDHVWGSAEFERAYPDYRIADIVRDISRDMGIEADFDNLTPLPFIHQGELEEDVLFIAGSGGSFKCWYKQAWLELAQRLQAQGIAVRVIGQPQQSKAVGELVDAGLTWQPTSTIRDALAAVSSAAAVVSIDTGLMHLALQQGTPCAAIWINNPGSLNYLRTVRHCFSVVSPRCVNACIGEELDKQLNLVTEFKQWCGYDSWTCHAETALRCMNNVTVDSVWLQVERALAYRAGTARHFAGA